VFTPNVTAHSGDDVNSAWLTSAVNMDGNITAGEWDDATELDLIAVDPLNGLAAYLYIKNDDTNLYLAYDAVGDTQKDDNDYASVGFDTGHDSLPADGEDHQFFQSTSGNPFTMLHPPANQAHFTYSTIATSWVEDCNPFDTVFPNHGELMANISFGTTPREPGTDHRTYEFRIPLSLLGVSSGDTIGFIGGSRPRWGVRDALTTDYSTWPEYFTSKPNLPEYGDLHLSTSSSDFPPSVNTFRPGEGPGEMYRIGDPVSVQWFATDDYPLPIGSINITYGSSMSWTPINGGIYSHANDGSEIWDTSGALPGSYYMNMSVYDSAGQTDYGLSNFTFELSDDNQPPEVTNVAINGLVWQTYSLSAIPPLNLGATLDDTATGGHTISMANYTSGIQNWPGTDMSADDGDYDEITEDVSITLGSPLASGDFLYCVYGQDVLGNANTVGDCAGLTIIDDIDPAVLFVRLNGSQSLTIPENAPSVILTARVDDSARGGSLIQNASYQVDGSPSAPMNPVDILDTDVEDFDATVDTSTLTVGTYSVCVYGADDKGNVNVSKICAGLDVVPPGTLDNEPPAIYGVLLSPATVGLSALPATVTISAVVDDSQTGNSNIGNANYTIGPTNWPSAVDMNAVDGNYDENNESVTASFSAPAAVGTYTYCVYAMDSWFPPNQNLAQNCVTLQVVDDLPPEISSVLLDGLSTLQVSFGYSLPVLLTATVDDVGNGGSAIGGANYTVGDSNWVSSVDMDASDGAFDDSFEDVEKTIDVSTRPKGNYLICVYGWDAVPNGNTTGDCAFLDILDITPPEISAVLLDNLPSLTLVVGHNTPVNINATIDDSATGGSDIAAGNYTIGVANWTSSAVLDAADGIFDSPLEVVEGTITVASWLQDTYDICVYALDSAGNANATGVCASLEIVSDEPPDITLTIDPTTLDEGQTSIITATITDDVGVDDSTVAIQILDENGEEIGNFTLSNGLTKTGSDYVLEREYDTAGEHTVRVWASDDNGNWNTVSHPFMVNAKEEGVDWTLWIIIILVIVVIVVVVVALMLKRRKGPEEEVMEEPPLTPDEEQVDEELPPPPIE
jgi:hypothetical protein